ncbi:MAG: hypothetical protein IIW75_06685 [Bacteroidaceae bacterium]|nr:hypothetical protein [Bacteroidaceae bacterium]
MTSKEIIDGVIISINAQIARRKGVAEKLHKTAKENNDYDMVIITGAQIQLLERIEKDLIQVEMNAKISYMGINTD